MTQKNETLGMVLEAYLGRYKPSSRKTVKRDLAPMVAWIGAGKLLDEVTEFDLLRYAGAKINCEDCNGGKPYAHNTRRMKLKAIRSFFNWCVKKYLLTDNPSKILDIPPEARSQTRDKAFSADERRALIAYAAGETSHSGRRPRDLALFLFCHDTGVRRGALAAMRRGDVDLVARTARVLNTKPKSGPRYYVVRFGDYAAKALGEWLADVPGDPDAYIWSTRDRGKPMSADSLSQITSRACNLLGIPPRSIHAWRHALAHRLIDAGHSVNYVAKVLDNTEEVSQRYYAPRDVDSAWDAALGVAYPDPAQKPAGKLVKFNKKSG